MKFPGNYSGPLKGLGYYLRLMLILAACLATVPAFPAAGQNTAEELGEPAVNSLSVLKDRWGVEVASIRLSAKGHLIDFRYRVLDPEKAKPLVGRNAKAYLVDQRTGTKRAVAEMEKVGALRAWSRDPIKGRTYFLLFANTAGPIGAGDRVTIEIDDFKVEDLVVQ